jgi:alanine racemase
MKFIVSALLVALLALCVVGVHVGIAARDNRKSDKFKFRQGSEIGNGERDEKMQHRLNGAPCSRAFVSCKDLGGYALAKTSTTTSEVRVLTERYESNLREIMSWLPERWDLVAVLKWSAYGNDINILGPIAARVAPALGVLSNDDASALSQFDPKVILRIGPTNYQLATDAVVKALHIQEFIGSRAELEAVTRVAKEHETIIVVSIYLFDHYGDPWGFEFDTPEELQHLVDSIDPRYVKVRGIFTHLGYLSDGPAAPITERVQRFLRVACPVAVNIAASLAPTDAPIMVHWGASSELSRFWNPKSGRLTLAPDLLDLADACISNPKVKFGIRIGSATYGSADNLPNLQPVLNWTSRISRLRRTASTTVAVVNVGTDNGYPRFFRESGKWGKVSIGGKFYPIAAAPQRHKLEVDIGRVYDAATVFVGAEVCLFCDNLTIDDLSRQWVAIDPYNIAMCATGAGAHFAEATSFSYKEKFPACAGPVVIVPDEVKEE